MARIRSVHPSLFTDEAWVSCSPLARLLYIGLWTDADDQGLFEWKPLQIKMRLLPGDDGDVPALLAELVAVNLIAGLEAGGKKLGAIRYFRRFQRPKKPNATFVLPIEWRTYVGLDGGGPELDPVEAARVRNQFPTEGEISPQMEDGGGRREDGVSVPNGTGASAASDLPDEAADPALALRDLPLAKRCWALAVLVLTERGGKTDAQARTFVGKLKRDGLTDDELWQVAEAAWAIGTRDPIPYMTTIAAKTIAERGVVGVVNPSEARQRAWMQEFVASPNSWRDGDRGPRPGEQGCRVSPEIQRDFGIEPAKPQPVRATA